MKKSLRNLLIFLGIAVLLFIGYFVFIKKGNTPPASTSSLSSTARNSAAAPLAASGNNVAGTQLLALLGRVSTLTLNDDILANPSFARLKDISITLPAVDMKGRRNPFAPIGTGVPASTATTPSTAATGSSSVTPNQ